MAARSGVAHGGGHMEHRLGVVVELLEDALQRLAREREQLDE
jgi:hypothetical protein